jgi:phage-related protein
VSNIGYATLSIVPDAKGFGAALAKETDGHSRKAGESGGAAFGGGLIGTVGKFVGPLAALFAGGAAVEFFKNAVEEASSLGESMNALSVVYGTNASGIMALGKTAAQSLGLSNLEFNNLAVRFSSFSKTIAGEGGNVTGTLKDLTGRAADFASVMNIDVAQAAELFQSGLAGETEPLRAYGIDLSAAAVATYALANGITDNAASMTEAQKVQARYGLLMQSTAQTAGDFHNTQDSLANVSRRLGASWDNLTAKIGSALLPALQAGAGLLNSTVVPAIERLVDGLGSGAGGVSIFSSAMAVLAPLFAGIVAAVQPFAPVIVSTFSTLGPQVLALVAAFSPLQLVLQSLLPVFPQLAALVASLAAAVGPLLGTALSVITPIVGMLVELLSGVLAAVLPAVTTMVGVLAEAFGDVGAALEPLISAIFPVLAAVISALFPILDALGELLPVVADLFGVVVGAIAPVIQIIGAVLTPVIQALLPVVTLVFESIAKIVSAVMQVVQGVIQVATGLISGNWSLVWTGILNIFSGIWEALKGVLSLALSTVVGLMTGGLANAQSVWTSVWNSVSSFFSGIWSSMVAATAAGISGVISWVSGIRGQVMGALSGAGEWLVSTGRNMIEGLIRGVQAVAGRIAETVLAPIRAAVAGVKGFLGIHSPSRLFMEIGGHTGEGMALGLESKADRIIEASESLIPTPPSFRSPDVALGGVAGALAASSGAREGDHWTIEYNDHSTSHEDKQAKLLRAQTVLEQSVAARRGR